MTPDQRILYERCYRAALAYRRAPTPEKRGAWEKARLAYAGDPAERASVTAERAPDFEAAVQVVMVLEELDADAARQAVLAVWQPGLSPQDAALQVHKRTVPA